MNATANRDEAGRTQLADTSPSAAPKSPSASSSSADSTPSGASPNLPNASEDSGATSPNGKRNNDQQSASPNSTASSANANTTNVPPPNSADPLVAGAIAAHGISLTENAQLCTPANPDGARAESGPQLRAGTGSDVAFVENPSPQYNRLEQIVSAPIRAAGLSEMGFAAEMAFGEWAKVYELGKHVYEQTFHPNRDKEHDY